MSDNAQRQSAELESAEAEKEQVVEQEKSKDVAEEPTSTALTTDDEAESPSPDSDAASTAAQEEGTMEPSTQQRPSGPQTPTGKPAKSVRKAHLSLSRVEPWSVMKFSFVISLVCFIILFVAIAVIYTIMSTLGVFDAVTELINALTSGADDADALPLNPESWFSPTRVLGYTGLVGALNIILITALSTVGAMLYNLSADLVGGIDVTLSESE
ncbi:DUF3566 domain-containing protein [Nocardiopsis ansamitocini]|nr:DUF3566 domain-containing protein [Nocardiopsis ansamitocini]